MLLPEILEELRKASGKGSPAVLYPQQSDVLLAFVKEANDTKSVAGNKKIEYMKAIEKSNEANRLLRQKVAELEAQLAEKRNAEAAAGREGFIAGAEYLSHLVYAGQATDGYKLVVDEYEQSVKYGEPFEPLLYC